MRFLSREKKLNLPGKGAVREGGRRKKSVYHPESISNTHPNTQHNKTPSKKPCLHLQKIKAAWPDGSACQNAVRDGVIAVSSSLATEASDKL